LTVESLEVAAGLDLLAGPSGSPSGGRDDTQDDLADELRERAAEYFNRSIQITPDLAPAYRELAAAQQAWNQGDQAVQTFDRLLRHIPDDVDALLVVGRHELRHGDPLRGRELILQAHRLRPLDPRITGDAWAAQLMTARADAEAGRWEEGRQAFAAAERLDPRGERRMQRLARQAVFEWKAGRTEFAEQLADAARAAALEPAPALLLLAAEAARYKLPRGVRERFHKEWLKALKNRCTSSTAGQMAEQMASFLLSDVEYVGRAEHVRGVLDYVRRSSRVKYHPEDLRNVGQFLLAADQPDELAKVVRKGRKNFPEHPYFHLMAGELEVRKGPFGCNRRAAVRSFGQALDLAENFDHLEATTWAEVARTRLTFLEQVGLPDPAAGPGPFGGRSVPSSPDEFVGMVAEMFERMGIDPDEAFAEMLDEMGDEMGDGRSPAFSPEHPEPRRQKKSKPKRKKK
jgi:tetratricopeptide (TPR) repeat protein